ncbi:SDR family oxidoreductase [Ancylobacter sp. IITR112]|uniref:SDR family oxidoreductase n=1 Tax=Ancylobacter sp. IITR112 TaxID=3138073 RepID=UPI00352B8C32
MNAIAPGYIATDTVDAMSKDTLAKIEGGNADEVARIVRFLVGGEATFVTGSKVTANGGLFMA